MVLCNRHPGLLNPNSRSLFLYFLKRHKIAFVAAWTTFSRLVPRRLRFEIRIPERPGATLARTIFIDRATTCLSIKEHTIPSGPLYERPSNAHSSNELFLENLGSNLHTRRHCIDLGLIDPDIPLSAGTTVPALRAFKAETL